MNADDKLKKLELDVLAIVQEKLEKGEMDASRAQAIAKMLLEKLVPPLTLEQLYAIAPTLDDHYIELTNAVLPLAQEHDAELRKVVTAHAEQLIKSGKLDEASTMLKNTLQI